MAITSVTPSGKHQTAKLKKRAKLGVFRGENERRRKQLIERVVLSVTLSFCVLLVFVVWYSEGRVLEGPTKFLEMFAPKDAQAPRDASQNCRHPKNRHTPYCLDREARTEADWQAMGRNQGGKTAPYVLHRKN